jgi:hypothetical protein
VDLPTIARRVLALALALGGLIEVLFFRTALGVNMAIAAVAVLAAAVMDSSSSCSPPGLPAH